MSKHYKGNIECIHAIEQLYKDSTNDGYVDYNRFQAFKYLWRLGNKDDVLKDLIKAKAFIDFAIEKAKHLPKKGELSPHFPGD